MKYYNLKSNNAYFLTGINPIWSVTENAETKSYIYHRFTTEWATRFFHFSTHLLIGLSIIFILFFVKKANKFLLAFTILLFIGLLFYFFLWYIQFYVHDYYTIMFYFFYVVLLINIFIILEKVQNPPWVSFLLKSLSIVLLLFNIHHTKKDILTRHEEFNSYPNDVLLSETAFRQHIREIGILPKDYIIAIPDGSPQISLCYLGNAGFTEFAEGKYDLDKIIQKKKQGAKFLIITDQEAYKALILQLGNPWSAYKTALIYKL